MYVKFTDGTIIQTSNIYSDFMSGHVSWYNAKGHLEQHPLKAVELITDTRPRLVSKEEVEELLKTYFTWSQLHESKEEESETVDIILDMMDYLAHTNQTLTRNGFLGTSHKKKVKVVYSYSIGSSTTINARVYIDANSKEYFVLSAKHGLPGVFSGMYSWDKDGDSKTWEDYRLPVELEIVGTFSQTESTPMLHRDDRPGC